MNPFKDKPTVTSPVTGSGRLFRNVIPAGQSYVFVHDDTGIAYGVISPIRRYQNDAQPSIGRQHVEQAGAEGLEVEVNSIGQVVEIGADGKEYFIGNPVAFWGGELPQDNPERAAMALVLPRADGSYKDTAVMRGLSDYMLEANGDQGKINVVQQFLLNVFPNDFAQHDDGEFVGVSTSGVAALERLSARLFGAQRKADAEEATSDEDAVLTAEDTGYDI